MLENGNPAAKLDTLLAVMAVLDLEILISPRSKGALGMEGEF